MFGKLSLFAAFVVPLASALSLLAPENAISGAPVTIKWKTEANDPDTWSFYLFNEAFNNNFGIANNVDPTPGELTLTLPSVPESDAYTLKAVNIGDVNDAYATTPRFSIRLASSSSVSRTATSPPSVSSRTTTTSSTTTTSRSSSLIIRTSSTLDTSSSSTTGTSSPTPVAPSSAASRQVDFRIGGMVLAIGGAVILAL